MRFAAVGLFLLALPSIVDSVATVVFGLSRRRGGPLPAPASPNRWLVLVPARREGAGIEPTLRSIAASLRACVGSGGQSDALLVLDGADSEATEAAARSGIRSVVKEPEGPSKGALLAWAAQEMREEISRFDGVVVLDAGNTIPEGFLSTLRLPEGADAVQARISSQGAGVAGVAGIAGVAGAAARSDLFSQGWEDQGRQGLGWSVWLRGFGMGLRSETFLRVVPLARTRVEDWEYSLLVPASGGRVALAGPDVVVFDEKVVDPRAAAAQRARWLSGQWHLVALHAGSIARWIARSPAEAIAFAAQLGARPFSLSIPLRLLAAACLFASGLEGWALIPLASAAATLACLAAAGTLTLRGGLRLAGTWLRALTLLPSAASRWMRSRP